MAPLKTRGDTAELAVALDLRRRGYHVAFPFGEDWSCDLIVCRQERLERVQVKHGRSRDGILVVSCRTQSLTNGRVRRVTRYTSDMVDWIAAYDAVTGRCFYVPAEELGAGRNTISLRLHAAKNGQRAGIREATRYTEI